MRCFTVEHALAHSGDISSAASLAEVDRVFADPDSKYPKPAQGIPITMGLGEVRARGFKSIIRAVDELRIIPEAIHEWSPMEADVLRASLYQSPLTGEVFLGPENSDTENALVLLNIGLLQPGVKSVEFIVPPDRVVAVDLTNEANPIVLVRMVPGDKFQILRMAPGPRWMLGMARKRVIEQMELSYDPEGNLSLTLPDDKILFATWNEISPGYVDNYRATVDGGLWVSMRTDDDQSNNPDVDNHFVIEGELAD